MNEVTNGIITYNGKQLRTFSFDVVDEVYDSNRDEYTKRWGYKFTPFCGTGFVIEHPTWTQLLVSVSQSFKLL